MNTFYDKLEKIKNSKKLNPSDKELKITEERISWIQKKMKPKRPIKKGEWWHDFKVFEKKLFDGIEFKHEEQEQLKT